jgi:hypothetical protein
VAGAYARLAPLGWRQMMANYVVHKAPNGEGLIKAWIRDVPVEQAALEVYAS